MPENPSTMPFVMTIIILAVILAIFAMKYGAQYLRDRATLASATVGKATDTDTRINILDEKSRTLDQRITHIETQLKAAE